MGTMNSEEERTPEPEARRVIEPTPPAAGDMPPEDFRRYAHEVVDWVVDYLGEVERYPVLSRSRPGEIAAAQPARAPTDPTRFEDILADFREQIVPGITHWNHPAFFGYFGTSGAAPGILGELLAATLNVNAMLWLTSPAATELEEVATDWLRQMLGLPDPFQGHIQDTASISTLVALAAARESLGLDIRERGLGGRDLPTLALYCSREAHSSVEKAAITLGMGSDAVRKIAVDEAFRMDAEALATTIERDIASGVRPCCIVATIGTTSTTSIDPIVPVAEVCRQHDLWLHVDAAYASAAAVVPEMRHLFAGWERADSIVVNPHKWLFVPIDCSVLLLRKPEVARRAFSLVPDYLATTDHLATTEGRSVTDLMDYGPALGRRFRSLKLWMTLRYFGQTGIAERIREHVRLADLFAQWLSEATDWEVVAPVPFSTVCFRYRPPNADAAACDTANRHILDHVNRRGHVFLSHTRLDGRFVLRLAIGNIRTEERHVELAWRELRDVAAEF